MKETLQSLRQTTCMKCRSAPARYYGRWAEEGLCRPCILAMTAEIRVKVLRDMDPADRKRWQLDNLLSLGDDPKPAGRRTSGEPTEKDVEAILRAVESGSESEVQARAARMGAKVVGGGERSDATKA